MLCLWLTSLALDGLSVYTLSDIYTGDASFLSSALHYNTVIYKYILHSFTHTRFTLTIPLPLPLYHTAHPFH